MTRMMEATVAEDPPGAEVVVSGGGNIGSSALHLENIPLIVTEIFFYVRPVIGAKADFDVDDC